MLRHDGIASMHVPKSTVVKRLFMSDLHWVFWATGKINFKTVNSGGFG